MKAADVQVADSRRGAGQHLQHDLKDRIPAWVPFKLQVLRQGFEGQVAVGKGIERCVPSPSQQFDKGWIARQVASQGSHVEDKPDQRRELAGVSRSERRSNNNILRAGIPLKQHLKGRQDGHEKRAAFARAE